MEEHPEVLWLGGIRPRHSVEVDFWLGGFGVPAELRRAEEAKEWRMERRVRRADVGWLQDAAGRARASTARGLRAQASGDEWRHAASSF